MCPASPQTGTSLTRAAPSSPSGTFAWKRHVRSERGKSEEVSQTIPRAAMETRGQEQVQAGAGQAHGLAGLSLPGRLPAVGTPLRPSAGAAAGLGWGQGLGRPGSSGPAAGVAGGLAAEDLASRWPWLRALTARAHIPKPPKPKDFRHHRGSTVLTAQLGKRAYCFQPCSMNTSWALGMSQAPDTSQAPGMSQAPGTSQALGTSWTPDTEAGRAQGRG